MKPKRTFRVDEKGCGAWEVSVRLCHVNMGDKDINNGKRTNVTLGLNWHLNPNTRTMLNYILTDVEEKGVNTGKAKILQLRVQVDW